VVIKLSVGVGELFVHGGAMCFELFPSMAHTRQDIYM
jgi:hypothetical protein